MIQVDSMKLCFHVFQPKTVEIIQKKLEVLSSMWESGSISYEVKASMSRLATALHKRRCDLAHDMHMALMMDYVSEVSALSIYYLIIKNYLRTCS